MKKILFAAAMLITNMAHAETIGRNGGWTYVEGPDGSCGPGATEPVLRWLRTTRTVSWDDQAMWTGADGVRSDVFKHEKDRVTGKWFWSGDVVVWLSVYDGWMVGGLRYIGPDGPKCSDTWMAST